MGRKRTTQVPKSVAKFIEHNIVIFVSHVMVLIRLKEVL